MISFTHTHTHIYTSSLTHTNTHTQENLAEADVVEILDSLKAGKTSKAGPRNGWFAAEPAGGLTTLMAPPPGLGFRVGWLE